jgi:hypothetical protein
MDHLACGWINGEVVTELAFLSARDQGVDDSSFLRTLHCSTERL